MLWPPALSSTAGCDVDDTAGVRGLGGQPEFKGQLPFLFGRTNEHESLNRGLIQQSFITCTPSSTRPGFRGECLWLTCVLCNVLDSWGISEAIFLRWLI